LPLALVAAQSAPAWASGTAPVLSIPVGSSPEAVATDPSTGTAYVANAGSGTVSVINEATSAVTSTIGVGGWPDAVATDPDTGTVFVANESSDNVSVISAATGAVTSTIAVGNDPDAIAVDPGTGTVFVANDDSASVSVISEATGTVVATIGVSTGPDAVAVNSATGTVFVANEAANNLSVISEAANPANDAVTGTIGVGDAPDAVAVDPGTGTVFVVNASSGSVSVINEATGATTATIPDAASGYPWAVAVDQATGMAYVTNADSGIVLAIYEDFDSSTHAYTYPVVDTIDVPGTGLQGVAVDPVTGNVYVLDTFADEVWLYNGIQLVAVNVSGSQAYGSASPVFTQTNDAPAGVTISGTASCATVNGGEAISATLAVGSYTIDSSGCTGLSASGGYAPWYNGGTFTVSQAPQSISFTAPATGVVGNSATLTATGGGSGNPVTFTVGSSSGVCSVSGDTVSYLATGPCVIDANQAGNASYTAAPQVSQTITVDQAPVFVTDSPPLTATFGKTYTYTFAASGIPAPTYKLAPGAPSWLSINASTGVLTGTPGLLPQTFTYSVIASNAAGTATAGPFKVQLEFAAPPPPPPPPPLQP
jgi:YVTN family beta-propeller protein